MQSFDPFVPPPQSQQQVHDFMGEWCRLGRALKLAKDKRRNGWTKSITSSEQVILVYVLEC